MMWGVLDSSKKDQVPVQHDPRGVMGAQRVAPASNDEAFVHSVLRQTSPRRIITRVVKKDIHRGLDLIVVEADRLFVTYQAKREVRARRRVLVLEHAITPPVEEHIAREELVPYPLVTIIDSDTEVEEDLMSPSLKTLA
ncbi:hypothetical protein TanjilG_27216 [Lupinus angustifolius]|uniref:Uncharacterized protein n=1 Tax=Lupinus angustifolius TaxID=3871 RepID=A0A394D886_LUPAN|nr:hypothetical protein TanjilG_27216 [Lupinus angustifolius]